MGIVHTPRVLASVAKGLWQRSTQNKNIGFVPGQPHIYTARAGMFDVDYLGHMNNAAVLTHAEYARWEMTATNGALQTMAKSNTHFMVASASVRFRRQIRPLFRKFQIESSLGGIDDQGFWMYQTFRYPEKGNNRLRTQVLLRGVAWKHGKVINPKALLEDMDVSSDMIESMIRPRKDETTMEELFVHFEEMDESLRQAAAEDDKAVLEEDEGKG